MIFLKITSLKIILGNATTKRQNGRLMEYRTEDESVQFIQQNHSNNTEATVEGI